MTVLNNLECRYLGNKNFKISWDTTHRICSSVMVFEISKQGSDKLYDIEMSAVSQVDYAKGVHRIQIANEVSNEHYFIVFGYSGNEVDNKFDVIQWCNSTGIDKILTVGLPIEGKLKYKFTGSNSRQSVRFELMSDLDVDIPKGYLHYSYSYCGIEFEYLIPDTIEAHSEKEYSIRVPEGYKNFKIFQERTMLEIEEFEEFGENRSALEIIKNWFHSLID